MNLVLEKIYRSHRQGLYSYALSLTGASQIAEDAVQNGFLRMVKNGSTKYFDEAKEEQQVAYVFRSVRNAAIDLGRSDQRRRSLSQALFESFNPNDTSGDPISNALTAERDSLLKEAIDGLDEKDQEAIVLKCFAGLTFEQAGQVANTSHKTIATRYRRALEKLQERLKGKL